jgi:hypothetical protein
VNSILSMDSNSRGGRSILERTMSAGVLSGGGGAGVTAGAMVGHTTAVKEGFIKRKKDNGIGYEDKLLHLQGSTLAYPTSANVRRKVINFISNICKYYSTSMV